MAGKTKSMSQIKQLLLLKKQNVSNRKAATQVGMDKETVNNYVRKALANPLGIDGLLLPAEDFEIRCYTDMKVAPNCCIYLGRDKHYYSVPFQHIGKKVHVEYTRTIVKVYSEGQLVATHKRDYAPGKYTIVNEHLASNSREYRNRTPERYIERCENMLPELGLLVRMMFMTSKLPPEMHYRSCDGLMSLQRSTDKSSFFPLYLIISNSSH